MTDLYDMSVICESRFIRIFSRRSTPADFGCLEWNGRLSSEGYGVMILNGRSVVAHRVAWVMTHRRQIPTDLVIDHLCCNRRCVNPKHLEAVTAAENMARITHPPEGWVQVEDGRFGVRRRYQSKTERNRMRREARRAAAAELPDRPVRASLRCRGAVFQVRWRQVRDGRKQERARSFASKDDAQRFIALLEAKAS